MEIGNRDSRMQVTIVDYGMGNVQSVSSALTKLGVRSKLSSKPDQIAKAKVLILPGVGAYGKAVQNLNEANLIDPLSEAVLSKNIPILGICLGMQLFAESSSEMGLNKGLNWIPGKVEIVAEESSQLSLPHVGWNEVFFEDNNGMFSRLSSGQNFYFDHSYHYEAPPEFVACTTEYGKKLVAGVRQKHIWGVQFHPEKSQTAGLKLLRNFLNFAKDKGAGKDA